MQHRVGLLAAVFALAPAAQAANQNSGVNPDQIFIGAGISSNSVSGSDDGTGFQFFGGYHFGKIANNLKLDLEIGYMDTGNMDVSVDVPFFGKVTTNARAKGLWSTGVLLLELNPQIDLIGRAGFDFGDDDGAMVGIGVGYNLNKQTQLRLEFVERDNVDSIQFNARFNLK
ncbi:MAG: outer membrane beta-barrel protein [Gammaproteobacteria bacterium]|nr:outer membrane beta-barrel protein [Gammaproteobacteria bacterium]